MAVVADQGPARVVDVSEVQLRLLMVRAGVWLTYVVCGAGIAYAAATWGQPNRAAIVLLLGAGAAGAIAIARLPTEEIARGRLAEPFFIAWSLLDIGLIAAIVVLDGGAASPFTAVFFLPMVFAALSYPLRSFVLVGAVDVLTFVAVAVATPEPRPEFVAFVAACLSSIAVMCAWQARNHERQRTLLNLISRTDPLTGCLNRRGFEERLEAELSEVTRGGRPLSLMLLDLDDFKAVNDRVGHAAGDELLTWVAAGIQRGVRAIDTVGRLGGDEFAVLISGASRRQAEEIAERVRDVVSERIAIGTGVATFPIDGVDVEELYRFADSRLYEMKQDVASSAIAGRRELSWAATLARAVEMRMGASGACMAVPYAAGLGRRLGWTGEDLEHLRMAAMLRDIGKVQIPDRILQKPGPLDPGELEAMRKHPVTGAEMVDRVEGVNLIAPWIRHSHENFDGSGYPERLAGNEIPLASRILRVVDAFDAMTNKRPWRGPLPREAAIEELRRGIGQEFDPRCVEAFEELLADESSLYASGAATAGLTSASAESAARSTSARTSDAGSEKRAST